MKPKSKRQFQAYLQTSGLLVILALLVSFLPPPSVQAATLPVFPGCQGFGCETVGGRGGQILKVTNLNDSGPGSLRAALETSGPRIVVFETSGTIKLKSFIKITNPYLTLAGQTAPSPGIMIRDYGIEIHTHDILIQHIRIRAGNEQPLADRLENLDTMNIAYSAESYNIVVDHVSLSWAIDGTFDIGGSAARERNLTLSNSILSEHLRTAGHEKGDHSRALLITAHTHKVSIIGNLLAHNVERNPIIGGDSRTVVANNLVYNWGGGKFNGLLLADRYGDVPKLGNFWISILKNVYLKGPNTAEPAVAITVRGPNEEVGPGTKVYLDDNIADVKVYQNDASFNPQVSTPPISIPGFTPKPSNQVYDSVLANAGARPADRDAVDKRVVQEVKDRKGKIINSQSEVGGWPVLAANKRTFNVPANPSGDDDKDGYTNIEEVLHQMAAEVEGKAPAPKSNSLPVFPDCQGYGCETVGGRGGQIIKVTNLNDTGPGSLRAAASASGPRIVVFEVSGTITLSQDIYINNPYITVAGQTAPSPGITLKNFGIAPQTHDVLIQHVRVRIGDQGGNNDVDAIGDIHNDKISEVYNIVIDHVSLSWAIDELVGSYGSNMTVSNSILSEALHDTIHYDRKPHSKAVLIGENSRNVAIIRNLFAHNNDRNPYYKGDTSGAIINNVIYDGVSLTDILNVGRYGETLPQKVQYAVVGNRYVKGLSWPDKQYAIRVLDMPSGSKVYHADNLIDPKINGFRVMLPSDQAGGSSFDPTVSSWPSELPTLANLNPMPASAVETYVSANAGARPADRDAVDVRVLNQLKNRTGKIIDSQSEVGGWPVLAANKRTFNVPANPSGDDDKDGYTNIEEVLHQMAAEVEGKAPAPKSNSLPVFPDCQGFGCETVGGRGGQIIKVTNLNDTGPGSLRAALETSGPRIVVFEISGTISLLKPIIVTNPYFTVAGQTAPSPGITLKNYPLFNETHDGLIQHIRSRPGDEKNEKVDAFVNYKNQTYNLVYDHVSMSWGTDEMFDVGPGQGLVERNITLSNSILSEALDWQSDNPSRASLVYQNSHYVSFINNLFAHNKDRNPAIKGDTRTAIVNNLFYNTGTGGATMFSNPEFLAKPSYGAVVNNHYIRGADTPTSHHAVRSRDLDSGSQVFINGNIREGNPAIEEFVTISNTFDPRVSNWPANLRPVPNLTIKPANQVYDYVLANAGARPADRDSVDVRVVNDVRNRTGKIIISQSEVGGWPTLAVNKRTFNVPSNPNGDDDNDGYTNIEEVLHQMAAEVEGKAAVAESNAFYVSPSGSDSNSCATAQNINTPKRTLNNAVKCLSAGKTLYIRGGTYKESLLDNIPAGVSWDSSVTIKNYQGETVILKPDPDTTFILHFVGPQKYIVIDGLILDGTNVNHGVVKITYSTATGYAHHIRLINSEVMNGHKQSGCTKVSGTTGGPCGQGILVTAGSDYNEFINLKVHDNGKTDFDHGLYIGSHNNLIEGSSFYSNAGWGIHKYPAGDNNIIRNNKIYNNARAGFRGVGIGMYGGKGNLVEGNTIYGNKDGISAQYGERDLKISNNTVHDNSGYGIFSEAPNTTLINNNVYKNGWNFGGTTITAPAPTPVPIPTPTPLPAPVITLSANPASIPSGQSSVLTWSSTNATACTASGGWSGNKDASGSQAVSPTQTTTYALSCTNTSGSATRSATVTVAAPINNSPVGVFDEITSQGVVRGWSYDPDASSVSNQVHIYIDGPAGSGTLLDGLPTGVARSDINQAKGIGGQHGFEYVIPGAYRDGQAHPVYVYAIDLTDSTSTALLLGSPKSFVTPTPPGAPTIGAIAISVPSATTAQISWQTDVAAYTKLRYCTSDYDCAVITPENLLKQTTHAAILTGLTPCTVYHYQILGRIDQTQAASPKQAFVTPGCIGNSEIKSVQAKRVETTGAILTHNRIKLSVPANFQTQAADFQLKELNAAEFFQAVDNPASKINIGNLAYDLSAHNQTKLDSFSQPLSITLSYDILPANFKAGSLVIYRYDGADWHPTSNCIHDQTQKEITCQTTQFSVFAIFGETETQTPPPPASGGGGGGGGGGSVIPPPQPPLATTPDPAVPAPEVSLPLDGRLVKDPGSPAIYVMEFGAKRPFVSFPVFEGLGYRLSNVATQDTSAIPLGAGIFAADQRRVRGSVVVQQGTVYFLGALLRYPIPSEAVFTSWGHEFRYVLPANAHDLALPLGPITELKIGP